MSSIPGPGRSYLQVTKPVTTSTEARAPRETITMRSPHTTVKRGPYSLKLKKAGMEQQRPSTANQSKNKEGKKEFFKGVSKKKEKKISSFHMDP